jgi:hypothetical protein
MRNACKILFRKPKGKRLLGRTWSIFEDNIRMDEEIRWEGVDWFRLTQDSDQWRLF